MARKYFGTDGIRGRVGEPPIMPDFVMRLGYAAGKVLAGADRHLSQGERPAVLIGKDTRISGYMLEAALQAGLSAAGVDSLLTGPMPTPVGRARSRLARRTPAARGEARRAAAAPRPQARRLRLLRQRHQSARAV
jgi:phosphoglucosamine mutase